MADVRDQVGSVRSNTGARFARTSPSASSTWLATGPEGLDGLADVLLSRERGGHDAVLAVAGEQVPVDHDVVQVEGVSASISNGIA